MSTRRLVLQLYHEMLREAQKLPSYNFRMYAGRKIRDTFRANKMISDHEQINKEITVANKNLEVLRRQAIIGHLYEADKSVIERKKKALHPSED